MPLVMEVGLSPGNFVFDGDQLPQKKGHTHPHPICGPCLMKTPFGMEVDLGPGHVVLDGVPGIRQRGTAAPSFRPMSIVATVAHLSYC